MSDNLTTLAYLPTIISFILALKFLSSPKHARLGNQLGAIGMALAIAVTLAQKHFYGLGYMLIAVGGLIGGGHPVGASGVRMLLDAAKQVSGTAGDYQVEDAKTFGTLNFGGSTATTVSFVVSTTKGD